MPDQSSLFGDALPPKTEASSAQSTRTPQQATTPTQQGDPLAARMRPRTIDEIAGQEHLLGPGKILRRAIEGDMITSMILWGPPGSGKTTLAEVIARQTNARFVTLSAVSAGVADIRRVIEEARKLRQFSKQRTILFIDEIHRFNKAQQDAVLPHVESGIVTLIGATTENPSFEVNAALLSRSRVFTLKALTEEQTEQILKQALKDPEHGLGSQNLKIESEALQQIAVFANGDARTALNALEVAVNLSEPAIEGQRIITIATIEEVMQHRALLYDKGGEQHFDAISALHKSLRGSDPDAGIYWLVRMLEGGEDPIYIVRRLIRFASEDVGMADPQALQVCVAAQQAVHFIGMPEAGVILAQAVVHLATAPKSNAVYTAYNQAMEEVRTNRNEPIPLHLRNAPTKLMKDLDYGKEYLYAHDQYREMEVEDPDRPPAIRLQEYLPENLKDRHFYQPTTQGQEASIARWMTRRRSKQ